MYSNILLRHILVSLLLAMSGCLVALADAHPAGLKVKDTQIEQTETQLVLGTVFDVSGLKDMKSDREIWVMPVLRSENTADSLEFAPVCIAGHNRYYLLMRQYGKVESSPWLFRASKVTDIPFSAVTEYKPWMEHSAFALRVQERGCCEADKIFADIPVDVLDFEPRVLEPQWAFITPPAEVKTRALSGSAYIDFPVNRTELYPDYRRNAYELDVIHKTINTVKDDADVTIDSVYIKGFASPEGAYANNARLAKGRTATLTDYVGKLCHFPAGIMHQTYEPEDWAGLVSRLKELNIENRDEILAIASDSSTEPDERNSMIQRRYPAQYKWLLENVYPALRHSDYTVHYTVADYSDPAKIAEVLRTAPGKLSLGEMFTLANTLEPGSKDYLDVFDIAVRLYPDNETANLNAANTAMMKKDYPLAARCLAKAGDSTEAVYLRGVLCALTDDYDGAMPLLRQAAASGLAQAADALRQIEEKKLTRDAH